MVYTADLKSAAERHTGSSPVSRTILKCISEDRLCNSVSLIEMALIICVISVFQYGKFPGVHIMENIAGFYPVHGGSIPSRRTR